MLAILFRGGVVVVFELLSATMLQIPNPGASTAPSGGERLDVGRRPLEPA